jgi:hypothetical protein
VRLTRRDQEQINELRKQLAVCSGGTLHTPENTGQDGLTKEVATTPTHEADTEAEASSTNQRLRRMSHLGRRTSTPLRELFQQSLAAAAAASMYADGKALYSSSSSPPLPGVVTCGLDEPEQQCVVEGGAERANLNHLQQRATGKRKSDAEAVLERLAASGEGGMDSPGKRRRTSLLPFSSSGEGSGLQRGRVLLPHEDGAPHDAQSRASEANGSGGTKAVVDNKKERRCDGGNADHVALDLSTMDEEEEDEGPLVGRDQRIDMSISVDFSSASQDSLPPSLALFDSSASVDTRPDRRSSFLRRTFSMKKLKPGTFTANKDPRVAFLRVRLPPPLCSALLSLCSLLSLNPLLTSKLFFGLRSSPPLLPYIAASG